MPQYHGSTRGLGNINRQELNDPLFAWQKGLWAEMALFGGGGIWPLSRLNATHTQILDLSGNANHLTISGAGSAVVGENLIIPVYSLPGGAVFAAAGAASALSMTTAMSFAIWAKHDVAATGASQWWFSKFSAGAPNNSYGFGLSATGIVRLRLSANGTNLLDFDVDPVDLGIDVTDWNFYAARYNGGTGDIRIWINDVRTDFSVGVPASVFNGTSVFRLGWQVDGKLCLPAAVTTTANLDALVQIYNQSRPMFGK